MREQLPNALIKDAADTIELLDQILNYLNDENILVEFDSITLNVSRLVNEKLIRQLVNKMIDDGYVIGGESNLYRITGPGKLFLDDTCFMWRKKPYTQIRAMKAINIAWKTMKRAANIIYALAILSVSIWAVTVSNNLSHQSERLELKMDAIDDTIIEQSDNLKSLEYRIEMLESNKNDTISK